MRYCKFKIMKISIIGCGYVGIVTGVCLANSGHKIYFYDKDKKKLQVMSQLILNILYFYLL